MDRHQQLLLLSFAILAVPSIIFMVNSRGIGWDTIGHVAEAQVYKQDVLPSVYGWNSYFLFGYPIHVYPPLSRFALAALMEAFDWATAVNLLLVLSCMAVIPSVYLFLVNFGYDKEKAAATCIFVALYMVSTYGSVNNSFLLATAFLTGLVANFFALPFFFLALAYFNKNLKVSAFCSAVVVLSNLVAAIMLGICLVILALMRLSENRSLREIGRLALFGAIVFVLISFWLVPYVERQLGQKTAITESRTWKYPPLGPSAIGATVTSVLCYLLFWKKIPANSWQALAAIALILAFLRVDLYASIYNSTVDRINMDRRVMSIFPMLLLYVLSAAYLIAKKDTAILKYFLFFLLAVFGAYFIFSTIGQSSQLLASLGFHFYRIEALADFLQIVIIGTAIATASKGRLGGTAPFLLALLFLAVGMLAPFSFVRVFQHPNEAGLAYDFSNVTTSGRALLYDGKTITNPHGSYFQFYLQTGRPVSNGLFIEEAELAPAELPYAQQMTRADVLVWGAAPFAYPRMFEANYTRAALFYSDLFWTTDLFVIPDMYRYQLDGDSSPLDASFQLMGEFKSNNATFRHYRIGNFSVADIRPVEPACTGSWKKLMYAWFDTNQTQIYYDSCKTVQYDRAAAEKASVEVLNYSNGRIDLMVHSDSAVPVFVKEAYDPDWKAYSDGGSLAVYRATPAFMEVFGKGRISLRYEPDANLHLFALLGAGLLFVAFAPSERVESWFLEKGKGKR